MEAEDPSGVPIQLK